MSGYMLGTSCYMCNKFWNVSNSTTKAVTKFIKIWLKYFTFIASHVSNIVINFMCEQSQVYHKSAFAQLYRWYDNGVS